jgi:hypothetical protein
MSEADNQRPAIQTSGLEPPRSSTTQSPKRQSGSQTHTSRTRQLLEGVINRSNLRPRADAVFSSVQHPNEEQSHSDCTARPLWQIIKDHLKKSVSKPKRLFNKKYATTTNVDAAGNATRSETHVSPSSVPPPTLPLTSSDTDASVVFEPMVGPADANSIRSSHSTYEEPTSTQKEDAASSSTNLLPPTKRVSENEAATGNKHHRTGSLHTQIVSQLFIDESSLPRLSISSRSPSPDLGAPSDQQLGKAKDQGTPPLDLHAVIIHPAHTPSGKKGHFKRQPAIVNLDTCCNFDAVSGAFANQFELERHTERMTAKLANSQSIELKEYVWLALEATVDAKPEWMRFWVVEGASDWNILFGENTIRANNLLEKARDPRPKNFWILTGDDGRNLSPGNVH